MMEKRPESTPWAALFQGSGERGTFQSYAHATAHLMGATPGAEKPEAKQMSGAWKWVQCISFESWVSHFLAVGSLGKVINPSP